ncbi:tetratricopeptide repeat protein [Sorangium sp. So ce302]|uniref:tetratricopeptide repeat protein n=1 Tax=Sorangium sp. So ce302 TaxID=3133297 RepID=UPI003F62BE8E
MRGPRSASWLPSWAALLLVLLAAASARAEAPLKRSRAVKELIREAGAALDRLDVARARELWGEVYDIERSNVAMCNMGQLDLRMGRWEEAVVELSQCVEHMPAPRTEVERRLYDHRHADLARARRRVGEVVLMPPPGVVGMFVNGRGVKDGSRVYVRPGQHEVMAVGQEGQVARAGVKVEAGESKEVPLTFDKPAQAPEDHAQPPKDRAQPPKGASGPGAPGPAAPKGPPQGAGRPGPDLRIVTTGAVASVGFLVAGTVSLQSAQGYEQEATAGRHHAEVMNRLDPTFQPDYDEMIDTAASGKLMRLLGTSALIAGAAAGAATLVYVWLPNDVQIRVTAHGAEVRVRW